MPAGKRSITSFAKRPRLSAMAAIGALGLSLLIAPAGIANAGSVRGVALGRCSLRAEHGRAIPDRLRRPRNSLVACTRLPDRSSRPLRPAELSARRHDAGGASVGGRITRLLRHPSEVGTAERVWECFDA